MSRFHPKASKTKLKTVSASDGKFYHFQNLISIFPCGGSLDGKEPSGFTKQDDGHLELVNCKTKLDHPVCKTKLDCLGKSSLI